MEGEEGGGIRLSKRFSDKGGTGVSVSGEVDYKDKAGTAWSHSYLNQKPWHPLSYPNQRRKWIAEQTHAQHQRRADEVSREYAQEQEFFRQTALISKKEKEKVEMMKAVSFMYVRPPGYNAESAKAAELADERKKQDHTDLSQDPNTDITSSTVPSDYMPGRDPLDQVKKKPRPKDVFGRPLPTEEEFEVLKNAPRLETGLPARAKPFGVEVRNVKCVRCGSYGHQSGDRECPLKDVIMPNEESRLKRDDPLTAILAHTDPSEPLKWELKQKPGISPPRGGFKPDDPNQQIVAEDIFDEYGGFLSGGNIPELLTNISSSKLVRKKSTKKSRQKKLSPKDSKESKAPREEGLSFPSNNGERLEEKYVKKQQKPQQHHFEMSSPDTSELRRHHKRIRHKNSHFRSSENSDFDKHHGHRKSRSKHSYSSEESDSSELGSHHVRRSHKHSFVRSLENSNSDMHLGHRKSRHKHSYSYEESDSSELGTHHKKSGHKHSYTMSSESSDSDIHHGRIKSRHKHSYSSEESDSLELGRHHKKNKHKHSYKRSPGNSDSDMHHGRKKGRHKHSYSSAESDSSELGRQLGHRKRRK